MRLELLNKEELCLFMNDKERLLDFYNSCIEEYNDKLIGYFKDPDPLSGNDLGLFDPVLGAVFCICCLAEISQGRVFEQNWRHVKFINQIKDLSYFIQYHIGAPLLAKGTIDAVEFFRSSFLLCSTVLNHRDLIESGYKGFDLYPRDYYYYFNRFTQEPFIGRTFSLTLSLAIAHIPEPVHRTVSKRTLLIHKSSKTFKRLSKFSRTLKTAGKVFSYSMLALAVFGFFIIFNAECFSKSCFRL